MSELVSETEMNMGSTAGLYKKQLVKIKSVISGQKTKDNQLHTGTRPQQCYQC